MAQAQIFIVRFWQDVVQGEGKQWRGVVIHVPTGERITVRSVDEATEVISAYLSPQISGEPPTLKRGER